MLVAVNHSKSHAHFVLKKLVNKIMKAFLCIIHYSTIYENHHKMNILHSFLPNSKQTILLLSSFFDQSDGLRLLDLIQ